MAGLLLSKQCLNTWQAAIISHIHPSNHPSFQPATHSSIHPFVSLTSHVPVHFSWVYKSSSSSIVLQWDMLQKKDNCQTSLFWLHVRSTRSSGWDLCSAVSVVWTPAHWYLPKQPWTGYLAATCSSSTALWKAQPASAGWKQYFSLGHE